MTSTTSINTQEQILDVAERLFAENGFAGTSLRSVIGEAKVNLSAVNYHFGSKEGLFSAVAGRIAKLVVTGQLKELAKCERSNKPPNVEDILKAFIMPPFQVILNSGDRSINCARFMGRCRTEPDPIREIAENHFKGSKEAFLDAFGRSLPNFSRNELAWKLDLVIATLLRVLTEAGKPNALIKDNSPESIKATVDKLVSFLASGLRS